MSLHNRITTLEGAPGKRLVFTLWDDPDDEGPPDGNVRPAPAGGWQFLHEGQWLTRAELKAEGFEVLLIHVQYEETP